MGGYLALWWWGFVPSRKLIVPDVAQAVLVLALILIFTLYAGVTARLRRERTQRAALEAALAMARTLAHELNNPLAVTMGRLQLARQRVSADHPVAQDLDSAAESTRRLQEAIQNLTALREFHIDRRGFVEFPGQTGREPNPSTSRGTR
jgi:signal transduction histidine kinase